MEIIRNFWNYLFGYDIFISYSRKDSMDYAYQLSTYFTNKKYRCYIDQVSSTRPGHQISRHIIRAVRSSKAFVLVGSPGAQQSGEKDPIPDEIDHFLSTKRNRPLIPININKAINTDNVRFKNPAATAIENRIFGLALVDESLENLSKGQPAESVLTRVHNSLNFTKTNIRLRNTSIGIALLVVLLLTWAVGLTRQINKSTKKNARLESLQAKLRKEMDSVQTVIVNDRKSLHEAKQQLKIKSTDIEGVRRRKLNF